MTKLFLNEVVNALDEARFRELSDKRLQDKGLPLEEHVEFRLRNSVRYYKDRADEYFAELSRIAAEEP